MLCFKNRKEEEKMRTSLWKKVQVGLVSLSAVSLLAACGMDDTDEPVMEEDTTMMEESVDTTMDLGMDSEEVVDQDIVGVAQSNPDFSILVSALQKANLVETLQGDGPFTVFAPTDAAFEKLLDALDITADQLLAQPDLDKVLTYHVVSGKVMADDLTNGMNTDTVNGEELTFDLSSDPMVNESNIITTDVEATNGVIHAIDTVLIPANFTLQEVPAE